MITLNVSNASIDYADGCFSSYNKIACTRYIHFIHIHAKTTECTLFHFLWLSEVSPKNKTILIDFMYYSNNNYF